MNIDARSAGQVLDRPPFLLLRNPNPKELQQLRAFPVPKCSRRRRSCEIPGFTRSFTASRAASRAASRTGSHAASRRASHTASRRVSHTASRGASHAASQLHAQFHALLYVFTRSFTASRTAFHARAHWNESSQVKNYSPNTQNRSADDGGTSELEMRAIAAAPWDLDCEGK